MSRADWERRAQERRYGSLADRRASERRAQVCEGVVAITRQGERRMAERRAFVGDWMRRFDEARNSST